MRPVLILVTCLGLTVASLAAERAVYYYTKKRQTDLLESPRSRQAPVASLPFRQKLEVIERDGPWLKVTAKGGSGWVYEGNVADKEPHKDVNLEFLPTSASETSASVAARPLSEVAKNYAGTKGKQEAAADVEWLEKQCDSVTSSNVVSYLTIHKKGEFQ